MQTTVVMWLSEMGNLAYNNHVKLLMLISFVFIIFSLLTF